MLPADYLPGIDGIIDLSNAVLAEISREDLAQMIEVLVARGDRRGARVAMVAPDDLAFGLSRMISSMADEPLPQERRVVRTFQEALNWLVPQPQNADSRDENGLRDVP